MKKTTSSRLTRTNVFSSIFHFPSKTWIFESQKAFTVKLIFNIAEILYKTFKMMTSIDWRHNSKFLMTNLKYNILVTKMLVTKSRNLLFWDWGHIYWFFWFFVICTCWWTIASIFLFFIIICTLKKVPTFYLISTLNWKCSSIWILWLTKLLKIRPSLAHFCA